MSRQVAFAAFWDMAISSASFFRSVSRLSSFFLISASYARALCSASEMSPAYLAMLLDVWLIRPDTLLFSASAATFRLSSSVFSACSLASSSSISLRFSSNSCSFFWS